MTSATPALQLRALRKHFGRPAVDGLVGVEGRGSMDLAAEPERAVFLGRRELADRNVIAEQPGCQGERRAHRENAGPARRR